MRTCKVKGLVAVNVWNVTGNVKFGRAHQTPTVVMLTMTVSFGVSC